MKRRYLLSTGLGLTIGFLGTFVPARLIEQQQTRQAGQLGRAVKLLVREHFQELSTLPKGTTDVAPLLFRNTVPRNPFCARTVHIVLTDVDGQPADGQTHEMGDFGCWVGKSEFKLFFFSSRKPATCVYRETLSHNAYDPGSI